MPKIYWFSHIRKLPANAYCAGVTRAGKTE